MDLSTLASTTIPSQGLQIIDRSGLIWILVVSLIIAFFLAFGVGANDVANSFGTSVGSGVLSLRQACILATIFEILGAISLGYNVSATIRGGMIYLEQYDKEYKLLMLGFLSALIGSTIWNLLATVAGLPVSGTHSIVGAIIGFSVVAKGFNSVKWSGLIKIVASWFISPLLSGIVSLVLFLIIRTLIINQENPLTRGLIALPIFYSVTVFINVFSIIHEGPHILKNINWWMALEISFSLAVMVAVIVWFVVVPKLKAKILNLLDVINKTKGPDGTSNSTSIELTDKLKSQSSNKLENNQQVEVVKDKHVPALKTESSLSKTFDTKETTVVSEGDDKPEVAQLFTFLQILTACFGSFAHGGNDVSNAIGPLVAVILIFKDGDPNGETPWYVLLYGGLGISIGLWVWGRKVIKTMGSDLVKITPSTGFTIEIGAAVTVLLASKIGLPVSTTHCKVGSVVMVGKANSSSSKQGQGVNWRLFANIAAAWILTVPLTGGMTAATMALLKLTV